MSKVMDKTSDQLYLAMFVGYSNMTTMLAAFDNYNIYKQRSSSRLLNRKL